MPDSKLFAPTQIIVKIVGTIWENKFAWEQKQNIPKKEEKKTHRKEECHTMAYTVHTLYANTRARKLKIHSSPNECCRSPYSDRKLYVMSIWFWIGCEFGEFLVDFFNKIAVAERRSIRPNCNCFNPREIIMFANRCIKRWRSIYQQIPSMVGINNQHF